MLGDAARPEGGRLLGPRPFAFEFFGSVAQKTRKSKMGCPIGRWKHDSLPNICGGPPPIVGFFEPRPFVIIVSSVGMLLEPKSTRDVH